MHLLLKYIQECLSTPLSESDTQLITKAFIPRRLKKRHFLLQEGNVCMHTAFVTSGAIRQYTIGEKGDEHILNLAN